MNVLMLSSKLFPKRVAITLLVLAVTLIAASVQSHAADRFWRSNGFRSSRVQSTPYRSSTRVATPSTRVPTPRTGYGSNFHRNFVIRQQQQRSQAGGSLIYRGNILWSR